MFLSYLASPFSGAPHWGPLFYVPELSEELLMDTFSLSALIIIYFLPLLFFPELWSHDGKVSVQPPVTLFIWMWTQTHCRLFFQSPGPTAGASHESCSFDSCGKSLGQPDIWSLVEDARICPKRWVFKYLIGLVLV